MQGKLGVIFIVCFTSQIHQLLAGNVRTVEVCLGNKTAEVQISPVDLTCQVNKIVRPTFTTVKAGYTFTPGVGIHKFHTQAKTWNEARRVCSQEGGHLAIINSKEEENVLKSLMKKDFKNIKGASGTTMAFVGAHSLFQTNDWLTIKNEPLASVGFNGWSADCYGWGQQPDKTEGRNCATISHECEGMSNHHCTKVRSFFCEIPVKC